MAECVQALSGSEYQRGRILPHSTGLKVSTEENGPQLTGLGISRREWSTLHMAGNIPLVSSLFGLEPRRWG